MSEFFECSKFDPLDERIIIVAIQKIKPVLQTIFVGMVDVDAQPVLKDTALNVKGRTPGAGPREDVVTRIVRTL